MNDIQLRKRIQAEYQSYLRGVKPYDYNGMFTKFLIKEKKIVPNLEKWKNELAPLAVAETENEIMGFGAVRGGIETKTDANGVLRAAPELKANVIIDQRLQENKSIVILRNFFKEQKEKGVKYIYELEEML